MTFTSVEQRMAQTYIDTFPQFVPDECAPVSIAEQEHLYGFMKSLYQLAFDEPLLFVSVLHEDDAYPNRFNSTSYGKPVLKINMRKFTKAMDLLLQNMFLLGQNSDVNLNKRQKVILHKLGIDDLTNLPAAWAWLAKRPESSFVAFSRCFFDKDYPYIKDIFARSIGNAAYLKLENWMLEQGYKRFDIYDITASDCQISLTYANPKWSKDRPKGGFEYRIKHTGISIRYDPVALQPTVLGLCIPKGLKTFLDAFDSMDNQLKRFIIARTKHCDGCRYCVQTDKTGSRPLAYIPVNYEQKKHSLCPYFPGFSYCWTSIDNELSDQLIEFLSFMDNFASKTL